MTTSSIGSTAAVLAPAPVTPASTNSKPASKPKPSSGAADSDSVHLSKTAQAQLSAAQAAVQEATETSFQTAKEAMRGDPQARRLLASEAQAQRTE